MIWLFLVKLLMQALKMQQNSDLRFAGNKPELAVC